MLLHVCACLMSHPLFPARVQDAEVEGGRRWAVAAAVDAAASSTATSTATCPSQGSWDGAFGYKRLQAGAPATSSASGATAPPCHSHAASGGGHAVQG